MRIRKLLRQVAARLSYEQRKHKIAKAEKELRVRLMQVSDLGLAIDRLGPSIWSLYLPLVADIFRERAGYCDVEKSLNRRIRHLRIKLMVLRQTVR